MNSALVKLKVNGANVIDTDIQNEIGSKDKKDNLETLLNARLRIRENSMNEVLKTILQKLYLNILLFYTLLYIKQIQQ